MIGVWQPWSLGLGVLLFSLTELANASARLAIIIDDIGYSQIQSERAARLPGNFTLSILPFTPHGFAIAQLAHQLGKELMLHAPMSNIQKISLGKGGLYSGMKREEFIATLHQDLASVPFIKGLNNHMGSQLTQEPEPMQWLMKDLAQRGLYFVDSRTTAKTRAFDIARENHLPSLKRDVFLDDDTQAPAIEFQLNRAIQLAKQRGFAIAIGHPYPTTMTMLENIQSTLEKHQITLVFVSKLLASPTNAESYQVNSPLNFCPVPPIVFWVKPKLHVSIEQSINAQLEGLLVISRDTSDTN